MKTTAVIFLVGACFALILGSTPSNTHLGGAQARDTIIDSSVVHTSLALRHCKQKEHEEIRVQSQQVVDELDDILQKLNDY